jgi:hypothetical protein
MQWHLQLSEYDYELVYRAGTQHSNADCLSRINMNTVLAITDMVTNDFTKFERSHKTVKTYLRNFVDKDNNWDTLLCYAMFTYNTTIHSSTGFTPYELIFGK